MSSEVLLLIVPDVDAAASGLVRGVLSHWPESSRPEIKPISFEELVADESPLNSVSAAWICCEDRDASDGGFFDAAAAVEDANLPGLISLAGDMRSLGETDSGGLVVAPPGASPETLCAVLRTVWAQARVVDMLRTENRFLRTHQGGLSDQMDKIDEELRLAAQLQREFLPTSPLPSINGVEFEVLYRPAGYVSGDIYDVLRLDENHIGFFLGDAVGHGVPAALMTMYIKRSLHTKEVRPETPKGYRIIPPNEAIATLNHDMCQHESGTVRFATACYGVIECSTGQLSFARGGHPYPMILRADGSIDTLDPDGAMLGIFPEEEFELAHTCLEPGDRFLMFSDGFETAFPERGGDAEQTLGLANKQFEREFLDLAKGQPKDAIQRLEIKLDQQIGSLNQQDDITLLFLNVSEQANIVAPDEPAQQIRAIAS